MGLKIFLPCARRASSIDGDIHFGLRSSGFVYGAQGNVLRFSKRTHTLQQGEVLYNRSTLRAAINTPREKSNLPSKLVLIDARWIIRDAYEKIAGDTSTSDEPRILRRCIATFADFLKMHKGNHPVAVVLPNENELKVLSSQLNSSKISQTQGLQNKPSIHLIPALRKAFRAFGVMVYTDKRHVCRDVIGSIAARQSEYGIPVIIVSSDSDFLQLLKQDLIVLMKRDSNANFEYISEQLFIDSIHGLQAKQYVDLLALVGKKGTFKGVPDIKEELAVVLISRYGTVEGLLAASRTALKSFKNRFGHNPSDFPEVEMPEFLTLRLARQLQRYRKDLLRARRRLSINQDVQANVRLRVRPRQPGLRTELDRILRNFHDLHRKKKSLLDVEGSTKGRGKRAIDPEFRTITSAVTATGYAGLLYSRDAGAPICSLQRKSDIPVGRPSPTDEYVDDILSTIRDSLALLPVFENVSNDRALIGVAVGGHQQKATYIDFSSFKSIPKSLKDLLQSNAIEKRGIFLRELYKYLLCNHSIALGGTLFDAHLALDMLKAGDQDLKDYVAVTAGFNDGGIRELLSNRRNYAPKHSAKQSTSLCCILFDRISTLRDKLDQEGLLQLALRVEFPLIRVLGNMELRGVPVSRSELDSLKRKNLERLLKTEREIKNLLTAYQSHAKRKGPPNEKIFRPHFGQNLTIDDLRKDIAKSQAWREEVERKAFDPNSPQVHRNLATLFARQKVLSKFVWRDLNQLRRCVKTDGRIRCTFDQSATATGRLTTRNPNLQTVPVRSQLGKELRNAFRANDGMLLLRADYSQIELRIVASLCGDPFMLDAFASGVDVHKCIAGKIFDISTAEVTTAQRNQAKQVVYSILYGISSVGLSDRLGESVRQAENLLSEFKIEFPAVQELTSQLVREASKTGYARTLLGRRLPLPMLGRGDPLERGAARRKAINMPIQGTQADMIKLSMVRIDERLRACSAGSGLVLQVHDELILEVRDDELPEVISVVEEEMVTALPLTNVDVAVQIRYGPSWSTSAHPSSR